MGVKKGLYYGFSGYRAPAVPRAPRSIRKRGCQRKILEDAKVSAFELLATVAGKLLQESESSSASSNAADISSQPACGIDVIKQEQDVDKPVKVKCHQESCEEKPLISGIVSQDCSRRYASKEFSSSNSDGNLEHVSLITSPNCLEKINDDVKLDTGRSITASGYGGSKAVEVCLDGQRESPNNDMKNRVVQLPNIVGEEKGKDLAVANTCTCYSILTVANLDRKVELPVCKHLIPGAYMSTQRSDVNLGSKDDDEKLSRCCKFGTKLKAFRPPPRIGDRRIRKLLKSKYWKVAPKLMNFEASNDGGRMKPVYHKRKTCYPHKRFQSENPLKRMKLFDQSSVVTTDAGSSAESITNIREKGVYGDKIGSTATRHGVKLSIKSFRVPELYIEVPETATVGMLKRTVMEAVTTMLEGGLRVGVLLRGKKIRDDNRTLQQTGISHNDNLNTLGFALEPSPSHAPSLVSPDDPPFLLPRDSPQPVNRSAAIAISDACFSDVSPDSPLVNTAVNNLDFIHDCLPPPTKLATDEPEPDSRAMVTVPSMSMEAIAVAPINQKSRRSELSQRRTRRPFSVSEVEALVQAVEDLGTGRWRDVKLRAFDNANHRTYVDLKDKWKTLVHTAKISPQQRRGEPVPQQLLDRVLAAHAYWSQHHEKQHGKHQTGTLRIAGPQAESVGA